MDAASDGNTRFDEASHWDALHATFPDAGRINHSEA